MGYLISETTKEERERIVSASLGNIFGVCDGCSPGVTEMYQDYIDGKKELRDITRPHMYKMRHGQRRKKRMWVYVDVEYSG